MTAILYGVSTTTALALRRLTSSFNCQTLLPQPRAAPAPSRTTIL